LTYAGGIITTPRARYAPERTELPPGTIRTPSSVVKLRAGYVALSMNDSVPPFVMLTSAPMRKPSRIPRFTHAFTRHPVGESASGSAARRMPSSIPLRSSTKAYCARGSSMAEAPAEKNWSIRNSSFADELPF